jgi:hypothetical protein
VAVVVGLLRSATELHFLPASAPPQVLPCPRRYGHAWALCPFAHPGEKARRRDVRIYHYAGVACPDMKKVRARDRRLPEQSGAHDYSRQ